MDLHEYLFIVAFVNQKDGKFGIHEFNGTTDLKCRDSIIGFIFGLGVDMLGNENYWKHTNCRVPISPTTAI